MMNLATLERMPRPGHEPSHWGYPGNLAAYRNQGIGKQLLDSTYMEYLEFSCP
jgi:hypothetical protein